VGTRFWIKRFLIVLAGAFAIIFAAQVLKSHDFAYSATQAAIWSVITATVFTVRGSSSLVVASIAQSAKTLLKCSKKIMAMMPNNSFKPRPLRGSA